ncbi:MAG: hypothetical protein MUC95_07095 [Spirochaetes bacterium]|nr:hypothetical protein [Spirochaetota bacterium]
MNNITYIDIRFNNKDEKRSYKFISTGTAQRKSKDDKSFSSYLMIAMRTSRTKSPQTGPESTQKTIIELLPAS